MPKPKPKPRPRRPLLLLRCDDCARPLSAAICSFELRETSRRRALCPSCTGDHLARMASEQRAQAEFLEAVWALLPSQTGIGLGEDGDEVSVR